MASIFYNLIYRLKALGAASLYDASDDVLPRCRRGPGFATADCSFRLSRAGFRFLQVRRPGRPAANCLGSIHQHLVYHSRLPLSRGPIFRHARDAGYSEHPEPGATAQPLAVSTGQRENRGRIGSENLSRRNDPGRDLCLLPFAFCPAPYAVYRLPPTGPPRLWCERGDSNPHPLRDQILSLARLPIPPLSRVTIIRQSNPGNGGRSSLA